MSVRNAKESSGTLFVGMLWYKMVIRGIVKNVVNVEIGESGIVIAAISVLMESLFLVNIAAGGEAVCIRGLNSTAILRGLSSYWLFVTLFFLIDSDKAGQRGGGWGGIRTPGGLHLGGFQDRCRKPLGYPSFQRLVEKPKHQYDENVMQIFLLLFLTCLTT